MFYKQNIFSRQCEFVQKRVVGSLTFSSPQERLIMQQKWAKKFHLFHGWQKKASPASHSESNMRLEHVSFSVSQALVEAS